MGSITNYLELELLDHIFNAAYTPAATLYLAMCTADPTDAATGASMNEMGNSGGYARVAIAFGAAASRVITQNADVDYTASGDWSADATHWCVTDSGTYGAGNALAHGALGTTRTVTSGDSPTVASGEVNVTFSAGKISDAVAVKLLDLAFRNQAYSAPDTYVGFTTAVITDSDTGSSVTEVSGGSYARKQVNVNGGSSPTWDVAASGAVDNTHDIVLPTATASWGTVTSMFIASAASAGDMIVYDNDIADTLVSSTDVVKYLAGELDVSLS